MGIYHRTRSWRTTWQLRKTSQKHDFHAHSRITLSWCQSPSLIDVGATTYSQNSIAISSSIERESISPVRLEIEGRRVQVPVLHHLLTKLTTVPTIMLWILHYWYAEGRETTMLATCQNLPRRKRQSKERELVCK